MYTYRAADSQGNTIEFLLIPTRDAEAAKCFFSFEMVWQTLQGFEVMNMKLTRFLGSMSTGRLTTWNQYLLAICAGR